jgi:hypothetical protein
MDRLDIFLFGMTLGFGAILVDYFLIPGGFY